MRSIRSQHPFMFKNKTLAQFFLTGKMFTPLMDSFVFLALFRTCDHSGKSSSFLSLKTKTVICIEDSGINKSLSSSSILGAIQLLYRSFRASHKGICMKWVQPVYLRTGLLILVKLSSKDGSQTTESVLISMEEMERSGLGCSDFFLPIFSDTSFLSKLWLICQSMFFYLYICYNSSGWKKV